MPNWRRWLYSRPQNFLPSPGAYVPVLKEDGTVTITRLSRLGFTIPSHTETEETAGEIDITSVPPKGLALVTATANIDTITADAGQKVRLYFYADTVVEHGGGISVEGGSNLNAAEGGYAWAEKIGSTVYITDYQAPESVVNNIDWGHSPDTVLFTNAIDDDFTGDPDETEKWDRFLALDTGLMVYQASVLTIGSDSLPDDDKIYGQTQTIADLDTHDWSIVGKVNKNFGVGFDDSVHPHAGIFVQNADDTIQALTTTGTALAYSRWTDPVTYINEPATINWASDGVSHKDWVFLKIVYDSTTNEYLMYGSYKGVIWVPVSAAIAQMAAPAKVGMGMWATDIADPRYAYFDWFRYFPNGDPGIVGG